jgi:hypothetical protein
MWLDCVRGKRCGHPFSVHGSHELWFGARRTMGLPREYHLSHKNWPFNKSSMSAGGCTASADSASTSSVQSGLIPDEVGLHRVVRHHRLVEV